jgi:hypothetical protein
MLERVRWPNLNSELSGDPDTYRNANRSDAAEGLPNLLDARIELENAVFVCGGRQFRLRRDGQLKGSRALRETDAHLRWELVECLELGIGKTGPQRARSFAGHGLQLEGYARQKFGESGSYFVFLTVRLYDKLPRSYAQYHKISFSGHVPSFLEQECNTKVWVVQSVLLQIRDQDGVGLLPDELLRGDAEDRMDEWTLTDRIGAPSADRNPRLALMRFLMNR